MPEMIIQTDPSLERRRQLAMQMMAQGGRTAPVDHWTQGANRIAQSLIGAYQANKADQQQAEQQKMGQEALQQAMAQLKAPSQPLEGAEGMQYDMGPGVPTQGDAISRFAQVLASNPYTQEYGTNMALNQELQKQQIAQQAELAKARRMGTADPSSVREYEFFKGLNPEQQAQYLTVKRSGVQKVGEQLYDVSGGQPRPMISPEQQTRQGMIEAQLASQEAQGKAAGAATGKLQVQRAAEIGGIMENARQAVSLIDNILEHPGLDYAIGRSSVLPIIPGTDAADFMPFYEQLRGQNFLRAFESLKGGGQITELEGQKAEQAMGRLQRSQTERQFKESMKELKNIIISGAERAQAGVMVQNPYTGDFGISSQTQPQQGPPPGYTLMQDANGNRAYVGPNGEIQEIP